MRLEGWGFRNPYGIGLDPITPGRLFATNNGSDIRTFPITGVPTIMGSRPISNDWDDMFILKTGGPAEFFGFPDFFHHPRTGAVLPVTDPMFCQPEGGLSFPCPPFVFDAAFRSSLVVQPAFAQFTLHSSANKFDFSTNSGFKFVGDIFVAETGAFVPVTGAQQFFGYRVVRVNRTNGTVTNFIINTGRTPEVIFDPAGFNNPIDVKFRGDTMFIVDFGVFEPGLMLQQPGTGKVWMVRSISANATDVNGDGRVDCADVAIVRAALGLRAGQPGFNPQADINQSGIVDMGDLAMVSRDLAPGTDCR
jgi:hypothetical protein